MRGEAPPALVEQAQFLRESFEQLQRSLALLADYLDRDMPVLPPEEDIDDELAEGKTDLQVGDAHARACALPVARLTRTRSWRSATAAAMRRCSSLRTRCGGSARSGCRG
jgi:hypothetical protein